MTDFNMPPGVSARDIPGQDEAPGLVDQLQAAASRASWPEDADLMTEAGAEIARLRSQVTTATNLIGAGLDLMTDEQVGQWAGVRTFLEQDTSDYLPIGEVIAERDRLRAEVEAPLNGLRKPDDSAPPCCGCCARHSRSPSFCAGVAIIHPFCVRTP